MVINANVQSLAAYAEHISTNVLLSQAHLLVLSETWLHADSPEVVINNYHSVHRTPCNKRSGGVFVYKRSDRDYSIMLHNHPQRSILPTGPRNYSEFRALLLGNTSFTRNNEATHPADIAILQVIPRDDVAFILAAIYVHQRTNNYCLENFLRRSLLDFSNIISSGDIQIPLILMGDFNTTIQDRDRLSDFLAKHFNLTLKNNPDESTTLGGTCIDLTFSRNLDLACQPYISYFYYHRPVFNKITLP